MEGYHLQTAGTREYATSPDGKVQYTRRLPGGDTGWALVFDRRGEEGQEEEEEKEGGGKMHPGLGTLGPG